MVGIALDVGGPGLVDEDVRMRRTAVDEAHRDPGIRRVGQRSLPFDPEELTAALRASTTSRSAAPARKSATTASIAIPQPAIAIPVCPVGTKTDFRPLPGGEVELDGDGLLPDRAVGADGEDDLGRDLEVLACGDAELGRRLPEVTQLDAVLPGETAQLGVVADELVQPAFEVEPRADRVLQELAPGGREAAALGRDADGRRGRPVGERFVDGGDDRDLAVALPALAESRIATTGSGA